MTRHIPEEVLSQLLRRHDPLRGDPGLSALQAAEMRRAVVTAVPERSTGWWPQLSPALSVAVLLAVALAVAWFPSATEQVPPLPVPMGETTVDSQTPSAGPGSYDSGNALENRKIQFETPGGTLVVWILDPNFPS
jgi:hypothetical protein